MDAAYPVTSIPVTHIAGELFLETKIGSLEAGKHADIAVWDRDPYSVPASQLKDLKCVMTLFEGEVVYISPDSPVRIASH